MLQSICSNSGAARCWPLTAEFLRGLQCSLGNPRWGNSVCFCEKTRKGNTNIVARLLQVQPEFLLSQWEWDVHSTQENQTVSLKMQNRVNVAKWSPQVWEQKPGYLHKGVREGDKPAGALENLSGREGDGTIGKGPPDVCGILQRWEQARGIGD